MIMPNELGLFASTFVQPSKKLCLQFAAMLTLFFENKVAYKTPNS